MYRPISLELINFGSFKHQFIPFKNNTTTLFVGENLTDRGQKANGAGKSLIPEGISVAITGSPMKKPLKDVDLIMDDAKFTTIIFKCFNPASNHHLNITRTIFRNNKPSELFIEGEKDITSVNEGNSKILECLGLKHKPSKNQTDIWDYFVLSKFRYTSFFSASDSNVKELINRFSKADQIQICVDSCEDDMKFYTKEIESYQDSINNKQVQISAFKEAHGINNDQTILGIKEENKTLKTQLNELIESIASSQELIELLKETKDSSSQSYNDINSKINELSTNIKEYEVLADELDKFLRNEIECPSCHHKFSLKEGSQITLEEAREMYPVIQDSVRDLIIERGLQQDLLKESENALESVKRDLRECEFNLRGLENDKRICERSINGNNDRIKALSKIENNSEKIIKLESEVKVLRDKLNLSENNLSIATEWKLRFIRFKGFLANKSLSNIESHANFYLEKLESDLRIKIDGYTPVNNGKEIREKINTRVFRNGKEAPFARFSGGERSRVEISIILAMQRIINQSTEGKGLNLLVLDEIGESLDSLGTELIVKALNKLDINVMFISQ